MDLKDMLEQKLQNLTSDFLEFQKDLQACFDNLINVTNDTESQEILHFLVNIQFKMAELSQKINTVEKQLELVVAAEERSFNENRNMEYSPKDAQLLQEAFETRINKNSDNFLDEPMKR